MPNPRRAALPFLAAALLFSTPAFGGEAQIDLGDFAYGGKSETITLQRAIEMALTNNLDSRFERVGISIEEARRRSAAGNFDPVFGLSTTRESLRRPQNANDFGSTEAVRQDNQITAINENTNAIRAAQGLAPLSRERVTIGIDETIFDQQNDRISSTLQGRTPLGTRYGLQVEANKLRNTYSGDLRTVFPEYQTSVSVTVIQPLLKNFGPAANLADLRIARINKRQQILTWKQRVATTIQSVMATYYEMLFAMRDVEVKQDAIRAGEKLLAQNRRRLELGFMSPIDVQQAEVAVNIDRETLVISKGFFMERQFTLKRLILEQFEASDDRVFIPGTIPTLGAPKINRPELMRLAFEKRFDYQSALLDADTQDIRLRFARNQLWPQVDLVGTYGLNGLQGNYGDAFDQGFSGHTPEWSAGVQIQVPLGFVKERAQLNLVKGLKQQAVLKIKQTELNVGVDVDTVISRIRTNQQRVETSRQSRELSDEAVRIGYKRLEEGQISSFDIIETQRKLYEARSRELAAVAELNKSVTQLWLATGTILEQNGIFFDERPVASKPPVTVAKAASLAPPAPAKKMAAATPAVKAATPAPRKRPRTSGPPK
ncbi:MAG TPA: TolC family protein [Chthoniobacteraceae bacterium]|jgi:outer membrane protein TolC